MLFLYSFRRRDGLRRCPDCTSRLACPISWEPEGATHWSIDLRCGDCGHRWGCVIPNERAARFDVELDLDQAALRDELRRLDLERMADEVDVFSTALARDLVGPDDFVC
jgi:hypothetical protein